jgi:hypothetical protein
MEPLNIFVSHVTEDAEVAGLLKETLEDDFAQGIELFVSSEVGAMHGGEKWLDAIQLQLQRSKAVIVLCSTVSIERPWVQFEVGAAWMKGLPIIPVCHSGLTLEHLKAPLAQMHGLELGEKQGVQCLYTTISRLLERRQDVEPRDLPALLAKIHRLEERLRGPFTAQFERYIDIIAPREALKVGTIPDDAAVRTDIKSLPLFGLLDASNASLAWHDIVAAAKDQPDSRWLGELERSIVQASRGRAFCPIQAIYHTDDGSFQPQLARMEVLRDGMLRFHVHLIETVVSRLANAPADIAALATLLRLGLRFRYEVIERFRTLETPAMPDSAIPADTLKQLRDAIQVIESDAHSRGSEHVDRNEVGLIFDSAADQAEMARLSAEWGDARVALFCGDPPPKAGDVAAIFNRMRAVNQRFMSIATARFGEVVRTDWGRPSLAAA